MEYAMNRFLVRQSLKPEFKLVQPLPVFPGVPTAQRAHAGVPKSMTLDFRPADQPKPLAAAKTELLTAAERSVLS